jgi:hypothetical protein
VQKATVRLLNAIFEPDFLPCSYGSRPGRSPHQALDELDRILFREPIWCVLELDIGSYFDAIVRKLLMEMIERRISDRSILRLIGKWIHVGVIDDGRLLSSETGIGQGQVISPLLANVYLHQVLDRWFEDEAEPRLKGKAFVVRYVDDAVICFQNQEDAQSTRSASQAILEIRVEFASTENTPRGVWARGPDDGGEAGHPACHVRVPRPHARLCEKPTRGIHGEGEDDEEAPEAQSQGCSPSASAATPSVGTAAHCSFLG